MEKNIYKVTKVAFGTVMGFIILLILFLQSTEYFCKIDFRLSNVKILGILMGLFFICTILYYIYKIKINTTWGRIKINFDKLAFVFTVILFLGQIYVFYNIFFLTGWDVETIRISASELAAGNKEGFLALQNYYSVYPNNLFIVFLNAFILRINNAVGIFTGEYTMMSCVLVNCLINSLACYLVYKTALLFVEKQFAFIGYCLAVLSVGVSPWTVIFYSDSVGLIIPILCFYLYVKPISNKIFRYVCRFMAVMVAITGYFIKPQCAIMLIAIVIIEIVHLFNNFKPQKILRLVVLILSCIMCFSVITQVINRCSEKVGIEIDDNKTLGVTHFFMMGLDETRGGVYSPNDVAFSHSFETADERRSANIEKAIERLENMGFCGYIKHICKKMLTTFNDGTFAWGKEGGFFVQVPEDLNSKMATFLKSIYYDGGSRNHYFLVFEQMVWMIILLFNFASCFFSVNKFKRKQISILWLTILGFVLYEVLFEVRARYVYIFVPIYCLLAVCGIERIIKYTKSRIDSLSSKKGV